MDESQKPGTNDNTWLELLKSEFGQELDRLVAHSKAGILSAQEFYDDAQIALTNYLVGMARDAENRSGKDNSNSTAFLESRYSQLVGNLPDWGKPKSYLRDRATFDKVTTIWLEEQGISPYTEQRRIVPREFRNGVRGEGEDRFAFGGRSIAVPRDDRMNSPANMNEIIPYVASLQGFGSAKTVERQYLNFRRSVVALVLINHENGVLHRDSLYWRAVALRHYLKGRTPDYQRLKRRLTAVLSQLEN